MNKDVCLNTRSPAASRNRITALTEPTRLILDELPTCSPSMEGDNFQTMEATVDDLSSPTQCKIVEFSTPISRKRGEEKEKRKSPEVDSGSPSSVLSPPPSTKRRTILDYYSSA